MSRGVKMGRVATFRGIHNQGKAKIFLLLIQYPDSWFSPLQMHRILGVPLETARCQVRRLHAIRPPYIRRRRVDDSPGPFGQFHYAYRLGARGRGWYERAVANGMPVERYLSEIQDWQREHSIS